MENQFGFFSLGKNTLTVPMALHAETRQKLLAGLKAAHVEFSGSVVFLEGGKSVYRHDTDHEELFRQESYFHYLFGVREPDCAGAIDLATGQSILFVPRLPESYAVWMGTIHPPSHFRDVYGVDQCHYMDEIADVMGKLNAQRILVLDGINTDSGTRHPGATFPGIEKFTVDKEVLYPVLTECRVCKTAKEINVMRYVAKLSAEAHKAVMREVAPGKMEYELESLFKHLVYAEGGCRNTSYTCICASGPNAAILHYGHAGAPNARTLQDGDMLMFDMGGEYHCYGADISRSFPVNGTFTQDQREVYSVVLAAADAVIAAMKPGVSWPSLHRLADRVILEKLVEFGFLQGSVDEMMQHFIASLFFPHGLGHLLGIDTHDVGGYPHGAKRVQEPGLKSLRCGRDLEEGMVITVEPGCYFIPILLKKAMADPATSKFFNKEKIERFFTFGGVRIEDDILVLKDGVENMSRFCPRTIDEIEAWMAGK